MQPAAAALQLGRVLVTGGTRGIGRAIAYALTRHGATVCVTHRWGSVSESELRTHFEAGGLSCPRMEECDASNQQQTADLVERLYRDWGGLESVVSGVAFGATVRELDELKRHSLELSMGYTAWPLLDLVQACAKQPNPPKRFLALSSGGVDRVYSGYEMVAVSKAALEALARYLAVRMRPRGVRVNVLRIGCVDTASLRAILPGVAEVASAKHLFLDEVLAADATVAILSGLMDGMTGQVIVVDNGIDLSPGIVACEGHTTA